MFYRLKDPEWQNVVNETQFDPKLLVYLVNKCG